MGFGDCETACTYSRGQAGAYGGSGEMAPLATGAVVVGVTLNPADAGADAGDLHPRARKGFGRSYETVFGDRDCLIASAVEFYGCG